MTIYALDAVDFQHLDDLDVADLRKFLAAHNVELDSIAIVDLIIDPDDRDEVFVSYFLKTWDGKIALHESRPIKKSFALPLLFEPPQFLRGFSRHLRWVAIKPTFNRTVHRHASAIKEARYIMSDVVARDSDAPLTATAIFVDATGNPTTPDDTPQWASSNETVARVSSTTIDGTKAVISLGIPGAAIVTCTSVDVDGTKIVLSGGITVQAGEAVNGEITFETGQVAPTADVTPAPVDVAPAAETLPADVAPAS